MLRRKASDLQLGALLVLLSIAVRLPSWRTFDFVTFDGAFYINQAKALLHFSLGGGVFSIGYPLVIAPVLLIVRDGVLAARLVSLLAAVGSVLLMYALCRRFVSRTLAFLGAAVLSVTPLFILVSVLSNAESASVFWLMLGVVFYEKWRATRSGLAIGMAAATRPEALAVAGGLGLARLRAPRGLVAFAVACAAVYALNVLAISVARDSFTPLSRTSAYRSPDAPWQALEKRLQDADAEAPEAKSDRGDYAVRMPRTLLALGRQLFPLIPLLALAGMVRKPNFVLAMLAPLPLLPLFTLERDQARLALLAPYLPPLIFYAMVALDAIRRPRARVIATGLVVLSTVACFWINRSVLKRGAESDFDTARGVGRRFASRVAPGDMMADRKPYLPLYSGARYVEIPVAPYDDTIDHLARAGVRYLSLHPKSVALRPALLPLVFDASAVRGEVRYRQVLVEPTGEMVLERARAEDPLSLRSLTAEKAVDFAPAWSPDGSRIAFRRATPDGVGAIWMVDASGTNARELVRTSVERDALAWSPDGKRIAYATMVGDQLDLFAVDVGTGRVAPLFESGDFEWSPSWSRATGALYFCGDPGGSPSVWMRERDRTPVRVSGDEPTDLAGVSPSGKFVTWVDLEGRLVLLETESRARHVVEEPRQILSPASWSPDERYVAVEAYDWGSSNVYVIDVGARTAMLLTKDISGEGMPSWSPKGGEIACLLDRDGAVGLSVIGDFSEHLRLFAAGGEVRVFDRPDETRVAPRENLRRVRAKETRP